MNIDKMKKENNLLWSRISLVENVPKLLSNDHHKHTEKIIYLKHIHKMKQYSRREYIKIAGIPLTNHHKRPTWGVHTSYIFKYWYQYWWT